MPEETDYHGLTIREKYADWYSDWLELNELVDANVKMSGNFADRPDSDEAPTNAWYEALDQNIIYVNKDNGWSAEYGKGSNDEPMPGTTHIESINAESINVEDSPTEETDVARLEEVDTKADDPHGNSQHEEDYIPDSERGAENGIAQLNDNSILREGQIPSLAITDVRVFDDEQGLIGWEEASQGYVGIIRDDNEHGEARILTTDDPSNLDNWQLLKTPRPPIDDVFGRTGSISAEEGDYTHDQVNAPSKGEFDEHDDNNDNPHNTSLEQVRSEDNSLGGNIDADGNNIENVDVLDIAQILLEGTEGGENDIIVINGNGDLLWETKVSSHNQLDDVGEDNHHERPIAGDNIEEENGIWNVEDAASGINSHDDLVDVDEDDHHGRYTDTEASNAAPIQDSSDINHDQTQGGSDASAHHEKYTDSEASDAAPVQSVNNETGNVNVDELNTSDVDNTNWGGPDILIDGQPVDGNDEIDFITE